MESVNAMDNIDKAYERIEHFHSIWNKVELSSAEINEYLELKEALTILGYDVPQKPYYQ